MLNSDSKEMNAGKNLSFRQAIVDSSFFTAFTEEKDVTMSDTVCLLCDGVFEDEDALKYHFLNVHDFDNCGVTLEEDCNSKSSLSRNTDPELSCCSSISTIIAPAQEISENSFDDERHLESHKISKPKQSSVISPAVVNQNNYMISPENVDSSTLVYKRHPVNHVTLKHNNSTLPNNKWSVLTREESMRVSPCQMSDHEHHLENHVIFKQSGSMSTSSLEVVRNPTLVKINGVTVDNTAWNAEDVDDCPDFETEFDSNNHQEDSYNDNDGIGEHETQDTISKIGLKQSERPRKNTFVHKLLKVIKHLKSRSHIQPVSRPHGCATCGESFRRLERLQQHRVIHDIIPFDKSLESSVRNTGHGKSMLSPSRRGLPSSARQTDEHFYGRGFMKNAEPHLESEETGPTVGKETSHEKVVQANLGPIAKHDAAYQFVCHSCENKYPSPVPPPGNDWSKLFICLFCRKVFKKGFISKHITKAHGHEKDLKFHTCYVVLFYKTIHSLPNKRLRIPPNCHKCGKRLSRDQGTDCLKLYNEPLTNPQINREYPSFNTHKCEDCGKILGCNNSYVDHRKVFHGEFDKLYVCRLCKKIYYTKSSLRNHINRFHYKKYVKYVKCCFCSKTYMFKHTLNLHIQGTHKGTPHKCKLCSRFFATIRERDIHSQTSHQKKNFICQFCGKIFHFKVHLTHHIRKHTGEKPYVCEVCGKSFTFGKDFYRHKKIHSNMYFFNCDICGKRLRRRRQMVSHMAVHMKKQQQDTD